MKTEIFINEGVHESRIAIVEDASLSEVWIERPENERIVGDVYKGTVTAVLPSLQAAFVDIGLERTAFLQVRDMAEASGSEFEEGEDSGGRRNGRRPRNLPAIQDLIRKGDQALVQIAKEPIGTKGARITTELSLAGRFVVLVPGGRFIGVSRKIASWSERRRLRDIVQRMRPTGYSVIVRTEGRGKNEREFRRDLKQLVRTHRRIRKESKRTRAPALVHKEMGMTTSVIRDLFTENTDRVVVDDKEQYRRIQAYVRSVSPELRNRVEYYRERRPIFDSAGIEEALEKLTNRSVWLQKGGSLVIDHAEAGTFVDVNSARSIGIRNQEESNLNTNLEAAREIARQLRLRDIGGIIVIDFIDMNDEKNRRKIVNELVEEVKKDRAKISISPQVSEFGLVEMTRQRVRPNLLHTHSEPCATCEGTGRVLGPDTTVTRIERWLQRSHAARGERRYVLRVHPDVAAYMHEDRDSRIKSIRKATKTRLQLEADAELTIADYRFISSQEMSDVTEVYTI